MKASEIEEKIEGLIDQLNDGESFVLADHIEELLLLIEINFGLTLYAKIHKTSRLFIDQYQDIAIKKSILLDFINDLVEIDLTKHILRELYEQSWSNDKPYKVDNYPIVTSSPLLKDDTIITKEKELKGLDDYINSRISDLNTSCNVVPNGKLQPISNNYVHSVQHFLISLITKISSIMFTSHNLIMMINSILLSIISFNIVWQNVQLKFNVYFYIYRAFIYSTSKDLYWWQNIPYAEEKIWPFLDSIKIKDQQFTIASKKSL